MRSGFVFRERPMIQVNRQRLLERFLRYVRIDTAADPASETYPSSEKQRVLGKLLAEELAAMSADGVVHDAHSLVHATRCFSLLG